METLSASSSSTLHRRVRWLVVGQVQGVGFRPFVARAAGSAGISGFVCNTPAGVMIEGQGGDAQLAAFERELRHAAPPAARIERIERYPIDLDPTERTFSIRA